MALEKTRYVLETSIANALGQEGTKRKDLVTRIQAREIGLILSGTQASDIETAANAWYQDLKIFERFDTIDHAFKDNRLTARTISSRAQEQKFSPHTLKGASFHEMTLDNTRDGVRLRLNPKNFLENNKNELGLHDLSAVLLRSGEKISGQLFNKGKFDYVVFMPLPLEEDLQALYLLATVAKHNRNSNLYASYVRMAASITRIKYGSDNDMTFGYLSIPKGDKEQHIRYGMYQMSGGVLTENVLDMLTQNALNYKTAIAGSNHTEENNEVTIAYRQHAGLYPMFGEPNGKGEFNLFTKDIKPFMTLKDNGSLLYQKFWT